MLLRFDFPRTFNDVLEESIPANFLATRNTVPAMDVTEYENQFIAVLELPGVAKEDVKITFEKDLLTIEGERKPMEIPQDARVLLNEVSVNKFSRSIRIPVGVDAAGIGAELEHGILKVVLPKSQESRMRTIAIK
jgi:HSP20 family protein